jgi:hypothetical protein
VSEVQRAKTGRRVGGVRRGRGGVSGVGGGVVYNAGESVSGERGKTVGQVVGIGGVGSMLFETWARRGQSREQRRAGEAVVSEVSGGGVVCNADESGSEERWAGGVRGVGAEVSDARRQRHGRGRESKEQRRAGEAVVSEVSGGIVCNASEAVSEERRKDGRARRRCQRWRCQRWRCQRCWGGVVCNAELVSEVLGDRRVGGVRRERVGERAKSKDGRARRWCQRYRGNERVGGATSEAVVSEGRWCQRC